MRGDGTRRNKRTCADRVLKQNPRGTPIREEEPKDVSRRTRTKNGQANEKRSKKKDRGRTGTAFRCGLKT